MRRGFLVNNLSFRVVDTFDKLSINMIDTFDKLSINPEPLKD